MGRVRLQITPSLAGIVNAQTSDWIVLEKEIGEGATLRDLLADLALGYTDFRKVVYNPETGEFGKQIMFVLNDGLVQPSDVSKVKLSDGDTIILLPVYSGG